MRRYLALGDSYTIGEGVADAERWPNQLAAFLRERGVPIGDPHVIAQTAWTTDELMDALDAERPRGPFDLLTLLVGVNDQYRSRPVQSFATTFKQLLRRAIGLTNRRASRVIAVSIPDWSATPLGAGRDRNLIGREILTFNTHARDLVSAAAARWVDVTEISRAMLDDSALVAVDGLHPTGAMYRRWAEQILPDALAVLAAQKKR